MKAVVVAIVFVICAPASALSTQHSALPPEFDLIRKLAATQNAESDPIVARAAFEEAISDAVVSRLYATPPMVANEAQAIDVLAINPGAKALVEKLGRVEKGANPFDPNADGIERALALRCAVEQVDRTDAAQAGVEQRRRVETALGAAREIDSLVLVSDCLTWLGLYSIESGDVTAARRFLGEAADIAERIGHGYGRFTTHRYLGLTYELEGDLASALGQTELAERAVAERALPKEFLATTGAALYVDLTNYATRTGDQAKAVAFARSHVDLLASLEAPAAARAESLERLGQLYARAAAGNAAQARLAAEALASAAKLWDGSGQADRAVIDFTGAGVLLIENASGAEARPILDRALAIAARSRSESLQAGVEYWLGRSYIAEAAGAPPKQARASYERAVAILGGALRRLDSVEDTAPELRMPLHFWLGRAYLEGPAPDAAAAVMHLDRAFGSALDAGDPNTAVLCAELALRALWVRGDEAGVRAKAVEFYDRLVASERIDALNAAGALAAELQRDAVGVKGVPPVVVALYDHVAAALAPKFEAKAANAAATVVITAAGARDRGLLVARASGAFDRLVAAGEKGMAQDLAEVVWGAWDALGDAAEAAKWRTRYEPLAEAGYTAARAAKRSQAAIGAAEGLRRAALARGDSEAAARWSGAVADLRRQSAEALEASGQLGLALDAWRVLAAAFSTEGNHAEAKRAFDRAAALASRNADRQGRADALAGRARAELDLGDARAALATTSEALALSSSVPVEGPDALPPASGVAFKRPAVAALVVRGEALSALARVAPDDATRTRLEGLARAAGELAGQLQKLDR